MIVFIGDVHGEFGFLNKVLAQIPTEATVIQVGDFGLWPVRGPLSHPALIRSVYFIDGNHEYAPWLRVDTVTEVRPNCIFVPRGTVLELDGKRLGFLGGADSIDRAYRTEGRDWFPEERITGAQGLKLIDAVGDTPLDILVTHTPPASTVEHMLAGRDIWPEFHVSARAVEGVWEALGRPLVVSGHMHPDEIVKYGKSIVLPILGALRVDDPKVEAA